MITISIILDVVTLLIYILGQKSNFENKVLDIEDLVKHGKKNKYVLDIFSLNNINVIKCIMCFQCVSKITELFFSCEVAGFWDTF